MTNYHRANALLSALAHIDGLVSIQWEPDGDAVHIVVADRASQNEAEKSVAQHIRTASEKLEVKISIDEDL